MRLCARSTHKNIHSTVRPSDRLCFSFSSANSSRAIDGVKSFSASNKAAAAVPITADSLSIIASSAEASTSRPSSKMEINVASKVRAISRSADSSATTALRYRGAKRTLSLRSSIDGLRVHSKSTANNFGANVVIFDGAVKEGIDAMQRREFVLHSLTIDGDERSHSDSTQFRYR